MFAVLLPLLLVQGVPLGSAYDPANPFAAIVAAPEGRPGVVIANNGAVAFMDHRPQALGHVLVVPRAPVVSLIDATPKQLADTMALARCVARAQVAAYAADGLTGITLQQNNGLPNQHVGHLHMHLIPRYAGPQPPASATPLRADEMEVLAAKLRAYLPTKEC
jgi:histidine triad (HIT) family protein